MGKSASGKDHIYARLAAHEGLGLKKLVLYTTRPIRAEEENGKQYYFVDDKKLEEFRSSGNLIEARAYHTVHGIGICGRCLCCHTYLSEFAPVSIRMAKEQNLSLNQTKISGVCGRLMCCLKNEQETYEELNRRLPGIGDTVTTPDGIQGNVQSVNVLRQLVKVVVEIGDEKEIQEFPVGELKFRSRKKKVKVSEQELKELKDLEDKKGDSKLDD